MSLYHLTHQKLPRTLTTEALLVFNKESKIIITWHCVFNSLWKLHVGGEKMGWECCCVSVTKELVNSVHINTSSMLFFFILFARQTKRSSYSCILSTDTCGVANGAYLNYCTANKRRTISSPKRQVCKATACRPNRQIDCIQLA